MHRGGTADNDVTLQQSFLPSGLTFAHTVRPEDVHLNDANLPTVGLPIPTHLPRIALDAFAGVHFGVAACADPAASNSAVAAAITEKRNT